MPEEASLISPVWPRGAKAWRIHAQSKLSPRGEPYWVDSLSRTSVATVPTTTASNARPAATTAGMTPPDDLFFMTAPFAARLVTGDRLSTLSTLPRPRAPKRAARRAHPDQLTPTVSGSRTTSPRGRDGRTGHQARSPSRIRMAAKHTKDIDRKGVVRGKRRSVR